MQLKLWYSLKMCMNYLQINGSWTFKIGSQRGSGVFAITCFYVENIIENALKQKQNSQKIYKSNIVPCQRLTFGIDNKPRTISTDWHKDEGNLWYAVCIVQRKRHEIHELNRIPSTLISRRQTNILRRWIFHCTATLNEYKRSKERACARMRTTSISGRDWILFVFSTQRSYMYMHSTYCTTTNKNNNSMCIELVFIGSTEYS